LTQSPELGFKLLLFLSKKMSFGFWSCFYAAAIILRLLLCNGSYTSPLTHK
jgi:hypothetical protein